MLDCSIRMALCCSALTIFDVGCSTVGLLCAFGWSTVGLNIGTLLSIWIGLVLRSVVKNASTGTRITSIHRRFNRESHPVERHGLPKGMVTPTLRLVRSVKRIFDLAAISTPGQPKSEQRLCAERRRHARYIWQWC